MRGSEGLNCPFSALFLRVGDYGGAYDVRVVITAYNSWSDKGGASGDPPRTSTTLTAS